MYKPHFFAEILSQKSRVRLIHCLLYTSDAADEEDSVDLGGRRIIKKKRLKVKGMFIVEGALS